MLAMTVERLKWARPARHGDILYRRRDIDFSSWLRRGLSERLYNLLAILALRQHVDLAQAAQCEKLAFGELKRRHGSFAAGDALPHSRNYGY